MTVQDNRQKTAWPHPEEADRVQVAGGVPPQYRRLRELRQQIAEELRPFSGDTPDVPTPFGATLTVERFLKDADAERRTVTVGIAGPTAGSDEIYVLHLKRGLQAVNCEGPAGQVEYVHPFTKHNLGTQVGLVQWYDWLLSRDAENAHEQVCQEEPWDSDELDAQLYRAEREIVRFDSSSANTENFHTAEEFTDWLRKACGPSTVQLSVMPLVDGQAFRRGAKLRLYCMGFDMTSGAPAADSADRLQVRALDYVVGEVHRQADGVESLGAGAGSRVGFQLTMDGPDVQRFHGDDMVRLSDVRGAFGTTEAIPRWWGITVEGVDGVLLVPARRAVVTLNYDNDGAEVWLNVDSQARFAEHARAEEFYRRRWGAHLDHTVQLSEQDIQSAVHRAEQQLIALVHKQRAAESPHPAPQDDADTSRGAQR